MGSRMNTILQTCFFAISKVLPREEAIEAIRESIRDTYGRKGEEIVKKNLPAVDETLAHLFEVKLPEAVTSQIEMPAPFSAEAPKFERDVLGAIYAGHGDEIPVSAFPPDGTFPTGTAKWEKRNIALEIPVWDAKTCIQCGKCAMVCPHAVIRIKVYDSSQSGRRAAHLQVGRTLAIKEWKGLKYTIQVAPEDCTGCGICVDICPAKNKSETRLKAINMMPQPPLRAAGKRELEVLSQYSRTGPPQHQSQQHPPATDSGAAVRILRSLLRLRRNAVSETGLAAFWGSRGSGQCNRLLVHLRWQSADHALGEKRGRPRPRLVQFAIRRQRRVRPGLPRFH